MREHRPSFPFYPKDWLGSASVSSMPLAAQGLYMRLLAFAWLSDGLPSDAEALRRLAGVERAEWKRNWPFVAPMWEATDGRLYQRKLEEVRAEVTAFTMAKREAGKKGGKATAEGKQSGKQSGKQEPSKPSSDGPAEPKPSSSSSSSSSSSVASVKQDPPSSPVAELFLAAWHHELPRLPRIEKLTDQRRRHLAARLKERPLGDWVGIMRRMAGSAFLHGENDRNWRADFDWLIANDANGTKVLEGRYDPRGQAQADDDDDIDDTGAPQPRPVDLGDGFAEIYVLTDGRWTPRRVRKPLTLTPVLS